MRSFTVHRRRRTIGDPEAEAAATIFVREGFAWAALVAPALWFLYHRMWLVLVGYLMVVVAVNVGLGALDLPGPANAIVHAVLQAMFATEANDLRRWTLARRGYDIVAVVIARSLVDAETRYFRRWHAELVADQKAHAAGNEARITFRHTASEPVVGLFPEGGPA